MDAEQLSAYGIDYTRGLRNCMGNLAFYKKILSMFQQDHCFTQAQAAWAAGNQQELFARMHELKGTSGSAGLMRLYEATVPLVELLRKGSTDLMSAAPLFAAVQAAYEQAYSGITAFLQAGE